MNGLVSCYREPETLSATRVRELVRMCLVFVLASMLLNLALCGRAVAEEPNSRNTVTENEKSGIRSVIQQLYKAYSNKDLDKVMAMEKTAIDASAEEYQKREKGKPEDVRKAFHDQTQEMFKSDKFGMRPLEIDGLEFRKVDGTIVVTSAVPIIATEKIPDMAAGNAVRIVIRMMMFEHKGDTFEIVKMYLH